MHPLNPDSEIAFGRAAALANDFLADATRHIPLPFFSSANHKASDLSTSMCRRA